MMSIVIVADKWLDRLELSRTAVNEPHLVGLIRVFKEYYPDVIVGEAAAGRASVFAVSGIKCEWFVAGICAKLGSVRIPNGATEQCRFFGPMSKIVKRLVLQRRLSR